MVLAVQRSMTLPFGGRLGGDDLARVRERVRLAARFAAVEQRISFDGPARERWIVRPTSHIVGITDPVSHPAKPHRVGA
jgi:hypothetical protein